MENEHWELEDFDAALSFLGRKLSYELLDPAEQRDVFDLFNRIRRQRDDFLKQRGLGEMMEELEQRNPRTFSGEMVHRGPGGPNAPDKSGTVFPGLHPEAEIRNFIPNQTFEDRIQRALETLLRNERI